MKLRDPKLIRGTAWVAAHLIRAWMGTVRLFYRPLGPNLDPRRRGLRGRYVYCFWHEGLLLPGFQCRNRNIRVLISRHADGELIAEVCRHLGIGVVRGSSTRGGVEALLGMQRAAETSHLAVTPDGPRGPRRHVQPGVVYLAAATGLPVVPIGIGFAHCWRAKSWDRFAVPRPFSNAYGVTGHPIIVPPHAEQSRPLLEAFRLRVEEAMHSVTTVAERWAETGRFDPLGYTSPLPQALAG
jgi:lysophospholipid acyltransferase (LPLAT)-like uncharacterized protein